MAMHLEWGCMCTGPIILWSTSTIKELTWTGTDFHAHAIHIYGGNNITVKNSKIYNVDGNGITVEADNANVLLIITRSIIRGVILSPPALLTMVFM